MQTINRQASAFDYEAQRWIQGPDAEELRRDQLKMELEILQSNGGARYLRFCGSTLTLEAAIAKVQAQLGGAL